MVEWFRNTTWNKEIEATFELKLKRARGGYSKAQYLRIQASYLLDSTEFAEIGINLMNRLFIEFPDEWSSVIPGHEQLGDYYFREGEFDLSEIEYLKVITFYHSNTRSNTSGMADIKLADLILFTCQKDKYRFAYKLITDDFEKSKGKLILNDDKYFYCLTRSRLANSIGILPDSQNYAKLALDLSKVTEPQFPRHKSVGLVKAKKDDINELEIIING
jgi:hypothetical protein